MQYQWTPDGYFRLFISHLSAHSKFACQLRDCLIRHGIAAFVAHEDIKPTNEWRLMIESALETMEGFLALLHPDFHTSEWCDQEVGFAIGTKKLLLAIELGARPHGFMGKWQPIHGLGKDHFFTLPREIAEAFASHQLTVQQMARGAVRAFRAADSFMEAKDKMLFVESISAADPSTINLLQEAPNDNGQIYHAWGIRERIKTVVTKWQNA